MFCPTDLKIISYAITIVGIKWAPNKLVKNIGLNHFRNIFVEKIALSDKQDTEIVRFKSNWPINGNFNENNSNQ